LVFERFTDRARRVLVLAQDEARLLGHSFIGTEHLLLGLVAEGEGVAAQVLQDMDISLEAVRGKVEETIGPAGSGSTEAPPFTPRSKKVLELSLREALALGHNYIGTEHILLGLIREGEGVGAQVLQSLGADLDRVREQVIEVLRGMPESRESRRRRHGAARPSGPFVRQTGSAFVRESGPSIEPTSGLPTGVTWRIEVVTAGRGQEQALAAYAELARQVERAGFDLDLLEAHAIVVTSVDTDSGPGLRCVVTIALPDEHKSEAASEPPHPRAAAAADDDEGEDVGE
jgi:ATP-dependent Clp protease ATP-binding subunit ClpA